MRDHSGMSEPQLSAREQRFEAARCRAGFLLAPVIFLVLWFWPIAGLSVPAHRLLAVMGAVVVLWVTEALPLAVTALLGPMLCLLVGVVPAEPGVEPVRRVFRSFADPVIFLFLGSFLLAEAMRLHGLNRRIAFFILDLPGVGRSPGRLLAAFGLVTGFISMWISNTATAAMMFPIALAILGETNRRENAGPGLSFGAALLLVTAFAASIGGLATPVGTPPNLIGLGLIRNQLGIDIPFLRWMAFGVPVAAVMIVVLTLHLRRACRASGPGAEVDSGWIAAERRRLGPLGAGARNVCLLFGLTVTLWILPGAIELVAGGANPVARWCKDYLPESMVALLGGLLLFALPVRFRAGEFTLSWREAAHIDWGTILLFGGGLALGDLMFSTGLARWLGEGLAGLLGARSLLGLVVLFTGTAIVLSETTSNTASAGMIIPVAIAVARAAGVDPLPPALGACLGASMGFMLPVSTPPNAIVYGSGAVPLRDMIRHGAGLDLIGFLVIVPVTTWLVPWLMK